MHPFALVLNRLGRAQPVQPPQQQQQQQQQQQSVSHVQQQQQPSQQHFAAVMPPGSHVASMPAGNPYYFAMLPPSAVPGPAVATTLPSTGAPATPGSGAMLAAPQYWPAGTFLVQPPAPLVMGAMMPQAYAHPPYRGGRFGAGSRAGGGGGAGRGRGTGPRGAPGSVPPAAEPATKRPRSPVDKDEAVAFCDVCEKGFRRRETYDAHVASHVQCPSCPFKASTRVLALHKLKMHSGFKLPQLDTPEQIAAYIAERKAKYPTAANIAQKAEEMRKRKERGELVPVKGRFARQAKQVRLADVSRTDSSEGRAAAAAAVAAAAATGTADASTAEQPQGAEGTEDQAQPEHAVASLLAAYLSASDGSSHDGGGSDRSADDDSAAEEDAGPEEASSAPPPGTDVGALAGAGGAGGACGVASNVELGPGAAAAEALSRARAQRHREPRRPCKYFAQGHCRLGGRCKFAHVRNTAETALGADGKRAPTAAGSGTPAATASSPVAATGAGGGGGGGVSRPTAQQSLLSKLLANEIRNEKSAILQCVRFIVQNAFFGVQPLASSAK